MKQSKSFSLVLGLLITSSSFAQENVKVDRECALYLAESSVKNAGWGVFAGKKYVPGDKVGQPGVGVQVMDTHNVRDNGALGEFIKSAANIGGINEAEQVFTFLPGIHSLANFHNIMANVFEGGLTKSTTDRYTDPLAGSYSEYHDFTYIAATDIAQGEEIFTKGPDKWFEKAGLPAEDDYSQAHSIILSLLEYHDEFPDVSEAQWVDILYRLKEEMIDSPGVAMLIPTTLEGVLEIQRQPIEEAVLESRDWEWVKENGYCLDHVREGPSTIIAAGRGAFATRNLERGAVITPVPLTQIVHRSALVANSSTNATSQLLLNYCFGHRKSQLLLCPTTHLALMNHNSKTPNAEIRWSKPSQNRLDKDINYRIEPLASMAVKDPELKMTHSTRLAFEVVATRDIVEGEELFLDYGSEWEAAFESHQREWAPPSTKKIPSPNELNNANAAISLSQDLPPEYTFECMIEPLAHERQSHYDQDEDYLSNADVSPKNWNDHMHLLYGDNDFLRWQPCNVLALNDDGTFRAEVLSKRLIVKQVRMRTIKNMPREAIRFNDNKYQSDQHLKSAFRHYIPIPDSIFPLRWRNDYRTAASMKLGKRTKGVDLTLPKNQHLHEQHEAAARNVSCGVYFAPSNIPNAGFGTYTALPLAGKGVVVGTSMPVIPVFGGWPRRWNGDDYVWHARTYSGEFETAGVPAPLSLSSVMAVNDGALANSHLGLVNEYVESSVFDPLLDRCKDPGAGASSDYVNYSFKSEFALGQGEELFVHYGEQWFTGREAFADVPVTKDWNDANFVLASVWALSHLENAELGDKETLGLVDMIRNNVIDEHRTRMALGTVSSMEELSRVVERNGAAQATMEVRTPEWFEEHGQCLDHVYVKRSTIPQAGNGGFARRIIRAGNVVISSPLMTTFGEDMFQLNNARANETVVGSKINDNLIFLNYQFSHPQSSAYFFPINHGYIFNHMSETMDVGKEPNAKLKWATWSKKSSYYLQKPLEDLEKELYSTMVLDIVATRDIGVDEEVLIDYGVEWEEAWKTHLNNWEPPCEKYGVMSSRAVKQMNEDKFNKDFHAWSDDHFNLCWVRNDQIGEFVHIITDGDIVPQGSQHKATTSFRGIDSEHPGFEYSLSGDENWRFPCVILNEDESKGTFNVAIFRFAMNSKIAELPKARILQIHNGIKANDVEFINRPFRSDMHWSGAFRHPIKIPDDIFPPQWKDLAGN